LQDFIVGLNDTERNGRSATVILEEMGLSEVRLQRMILSLATSGDLLNRALVTSNQAWKDNNALTKEAEKRYASTESQAQLAANAYNNLKVALGDNFTPVMREFYNIQRVVFGGLEKFVQEHPEVVAALTATTVAVGAGAATLGVMAAAIKIKTMLTNEDTKANLAWLLSLGPIAAALGIGAAALGVFVGTLVYVDTAGRKAYERTKELTTVSTEQLLEIEKLRKEHQKIVETYGREVEEAQKLQSQIDALTDTYDKQRQAHEKMIEEHQVLMEAYQKDYEAYEAAKDAIDDQAAKAEYLISKLYELGTASDGAAANQKQIEAIVASLNEEFPELALNLDEIINGESQVFDSLREKAEAALAAEQQAANWNTLMSKVKLSPALKSDVDAQKLRLDQARKNMSAFWAEYKEVEFSHVGQQELEKKYGIDNAFLYNKELTKEFQAAQEAFDDATDAYNENEQSISRLSGEMGEYGRQQEEVAAATADINALTSGLTTEMALLAEKYNTAYTAASESIEGQYQLWDKAAKAVPTSIREVTLALDSQQKYWDAYGDNLDSLSRRTGDIEGLADMIATFADGSPESVNMIAGMEKASDEDLRKMVKSWLAVEQAEEDAKTSLAQTVVDFDAKMAELQLKTEEAIKGMTLSELAAESGKNTIEGFISAAKDLQPEVEAAYGKLGQAAIDAMNTQRIGVPRYNPWTGSVPAHAGGTTFGEGAYIAGERGAELILGARGSTVFPARETERIIEAVDRYSGRDGVGQMVINLSPVYNLSGVASGSDVENALSQGNENLRRLVADVIENAERDRRRRAFV
jgi:hypothetical protein